MECKAFNHSFKREFIMSVQKEYEKKFEIEEYEILILVEAP